MERLDVTYRGFSDVLFEEAFALSLKVRMTTVITLVMNNSTTFVEVLMYLALFEINNRNILKQDTSILPQRLYLALFEINNRNIFVFHASSPPHTIYMIQDRRITFVKIVIVTQF